MQRISILVRMSPDLKDRLIGALWEAEPGPDGRKPTLNNLVCALLDEGLERLEEDGEETDA